MKKALLGVRNIALAVVVAGIAGVGLGSVASAATLVDPAPVFQVNEAGQTFGRGDGPVDPDLIRAQGNNGKVGYVLKTDLVGPEMRSPDDVARWLVEFPQDQPRDIPVYESDGKTVIDTFTIAAAELDVEPGK